MALVVANATSTGAQVMASDGAQPLLGLVVRFGRLNNDGTPFKGVNGAYVTKFVTTTIGTDYIDGFDINKQAADGSLCVVKKTPQVQKNKTVAIEPCSEDPELRELIYGGVLFSTTGTTPTVVGYGDPQFGTIGRPEGVSMEFWTDSALGSATGGTAGGGRYFQHFLPRVYLTPTDREYASDAVSFGYEGYGVENPAIGTGPGGSGATGWTYDSTRMYAWRRTAAIPAAQVGYVDTTAA